jgi:F420-dependent oxidoreductase-like protein
MLAGMRFSIWPDLDEPWPDLRALVTHADATGWDTVYVEDHFIVHSDQAAPLMEATGTLAALAAATERIRLGTLVLSVTYRHPAVIANWAATVDQLSAGRLVLGLGAGWEEHEHAAYGLPLGSPGERVDRFVEGLAVVQGLLTQSRTTVEGRYFQVRDAACEPKPHQDHVPILVGARGPRMLGVVAEHADRWNMWGSPAQVAEKAAVLDAHCERLGRDPRSIERSAQAMLCVTDDRARADAFVEQHAPSGRAAMAGTATEVAERVAAYAEVGVDEFIVLTSDLGRGTERLDTLDSLQAALAATQS